MKKRIKNKNTKVPVKKIVLTTLAVAGFMTVAVLAPNALQVYRQFYPDKKRRKYDEERFINNSIKSLLKKGLVEFEKDNLILTPKGRKEISKYELEDFEIEKPKKWDKKWRIVIFDIKETRRGTREILRNTLVRLGFVKLQNSVWVFPYECEELVVMMRSHLFIGKDVLYITAENVGNDKWLKEYFGL